MNPVQKKRKTHLFSIANKQKKCESIKKAKKISLQNTQGAQIQCRLSH
jgi:hypothetical protein